MDCVKCGNEMIKGTINTKIDIWGEEKIRPPFALTQTSYSPVYVYVCEKCGYMEFYTNPNSSK